jgi:hypothetical protein
MFLYHIRFTSGDEEFEKIGITKHSPFKRFGVDNYLEYTLKVLDIQELPDKECKLKEKELHNKFKEFKYTPLNEDFSGKTECFFIDSVSLN